MTTGDISAASCHAKIRFSARLAKSGGQLPECEDRSAHDFSGVALRAALSDGASASLLAGEWAELLVAAYCSNVTDDPAALILNIEQQAAAWNELADQRNLPWYAVAKRATGAFASLVGVCITADGKWTATAVGDSCVFQVRRQPVAGSEVAGCLVAFPLSRSGQFGSTPDLIGTKVAPDSGRLAFSASQWSAADDLYLMTDALAEWFLGEVQQKREPWRWFDALEVQSNPMPFEKLVNDLRVSGKLKDDDVTLLHIKLSDA